MLSELSKLTFSPFILSIRYKHMGLKPKKTRAKVLILRVLLYVYVRGRFAQAPVPTASEHTREMLHETFVNLEAIHLKAVCMLLLLERAPYTQVFRAVYSNTHMLANQEYYSPQILDRVLFSSVLGSPQVPL